MNSTLFQLVFISLFALSQIAGTCFGQSNRVVELPGAVDASVVGGGGRLLFFSIPSLGKIAVVDSRQAKVVRYLSVPPRITMAAGREYLFVVNIERETMSRIDLTTLEIDNTRSLPFPGTIRYMAMGCDSTGPFLIRTENEAEGRNATFDFMKVSMDMLKSKWPFGFNKDLSRRNRIRASSNGSMFVIDDVGYVGLDGKKVCSTEDMAKNFRDARFGGSGPILPSHDANFYAYSGKVLDKDLKTISDRNTDHGIMIPSLTGPFFLSYSDDGKKVGLYRFGEDRVLANLKDICSPFTGQSPPYSVAIDPRDRVFFLSDIGIVATLDVIKNQLVLQAIDVIEEIRNSGVDYLFVLSAPPQTAELGATFSYQIDVQSSAKKVKYRLATGPKGMSVSGTGEVTWQVPIEMTKTHHKVELRIEDSAGQETGHSFVIGIPEVIEHSVASDLDSREASDSEKRSTRTVFEFRDWHDSSGKRIGRAKYMGLKEQSKVLLKSEEGAEIEIRLSSLSKEDIYVAVISELKIRNLWGGELHQSGNEKTSQ